VKYLIITVTHNRGRRGYRMIYPEPYDPTESMRNRRGPILYEGGITADLNEDTDEAMVWMNDALADKYAAASPDMRIVSDARAQIFMDNARSLVGIPEEQVTDVNRVQAISAKVAAGVALTVEDRDALDPDKKVAGINRKRKTLAGYFGA
jgi:hypothetical protein